jgi:hypothetical protein
LLIRREGNAMLRKFVKERRAADPIDDPRQSGERKAPVSRRS